MGYVDCDSHVIETDDTWAYLSEREREYRPWTVEYTEQIIPNAPLRRMWLAQDCWNARLPPDGNVRSNMHIYDGAATCLTDVSARVDDLNSLGIDFQVLISSFFLSIEIENPLAEVALTRSYNRWMADRVTGCGGRFGWTVCPPTRSMDLALKELEFGKSHGAVGVHLKGIEHGYYLSDPYFFPLYAKAQELDLAIVVHIGTAINRIDNQVIGVLAPRPEAFMVHLSSVMHGLHSVIGNPLHTLFPQLRWAFLEAGATWAPAVLQRHSRLVASAAEFQAVNQGDLVVHHIEPELLLEKNVFIACDSDEDLSYLSSRLGDGTLITGTDYGHNDAGTQITVYSELENRADVPQGVTHKIVDTNGRKLFSIPDDFRPSDSLPRRVTQHVRPFEPSSPSPMSVSAQ